LILFAFPQAGRFQRQPCELTSFGFKVYQVLLRETSSILSTLQQATRLRYRGAFYPSLDATNVCAPFGLTKFFGPIFSTIYQP